MKQETAVYQATIAVLAENNIKFEDGMDVSAVMSKDMIAAVSVILCTGFQEGKIDFKDTPSNREKLASPAKLKSYVSGLISNWYRKDERLNGGEKYQPKNPGSRTGSTDPQLKALRQVLSQFKGTDKEQAIQAQIDSRLAQIHSEKAKKVTVDISALPAELVAQLGLNK